MAAAPVGLAETASTEDTDDDSDFEWGLLGLLGLLGLFRRGGGTTVVTRENYISPPSGTRPGRPFTPPEERTMNLNPRPGEGGDPNARR
jgi:MYXO-CTERM domain-containing protein